MRSGNKTQEEHKDGKKRTDDASLEETPQENAWADCEDSYKKDRKEKWAIKTNCPFFPR